MLDRPTAAVVFDAPFTDRTAWAVGRTSAYPEDGRNPDDNKLDVIGPGYGPTADGVFTARRARGGDWHTALVSTEYAPGGFELLPDDELTATCVVHDVQGAWPALWTWGRDKGGRPQPGHGEVDAFEYHPTHPGLLELTNHVRPAAHYAEGAVTAGRPFALRVVFGTASVEWYADGRLLYADHRGVGPHWRAWPIVCVSVAAGRYGHLPPRPGTAELHWQCTALTVRRAPAASGRAGDTSGVRDQDHPA
ncbi:beta-glucanase [Streptomyces sp. NBC_00433]